MARTGLYVPVDVTFPDDDKIIDAGLDGSGLYLQACCRAKSLLTDGRLTRGQLHRLGATNELIERLIDLGLFTRDAPHAVRITAWEAHHKPASEIIDSTKGGQLAHQRWHEKKGIRKPGCEWCYPPQTADPQVNADDHASHDAPAPAPQSVRDAQHAMPETETETETSLLSSQSETTTRGPSPTDEKTNEQQQPDPDPTPQASAKRRALDAIDLIAQRNHDTATTRGGIDNPAGHLAACRRNARTQHYTAARDLADGGATPQQIADQLNPPSHSGGSVPLEQSTNPVIAAARLAEQAPDDDAPVASRDTARDAAARGKALLGAARRPTGDTAA